jgi:hypothetical protein
VKRIIYVSHDQLNARYGALKGTNPKEDLIVLVESARMLTEEFAGNHRIAQQLFGIKRLKDMPEVRKRAQEVLAGLGKGLI